MPLYPPLDDPYHPDTTVSDVPPFPPGPDRSTLDDPFIWGVAHDLGIDYPTLTQLDEAELDALAYYFGAPPPGTPRRSPSQRAKQRSKAAFGAAQGALASSSSKPQTSKGKTAPFARCSAWESDPNTGQLYDLGSGIATIERPFRNSRRQGAVVLRVSHALAKNRNTPEDLTGCYVYASKDGKVVYEGKVVDFDRGTHKELGTTRIYTCTPGELI